MGTDEADGPDKTSTATKRRPRQNVDRDKTSTAGAENRRGRLSVLYPDRKAHARKNRRRG
jgi:hypothetical protein